jgi:hypothetical protein
MYLQKEVRVMSDGREEREEREKRREWEKKEMEKSERSRDYTPASDWENDWRPERRDS